MDDLTKIFLVKLGMELLSILLPMLAAGLVGLVIKQWKLLSVKIAKEQPVAYEILTVIAKEAVHCAEQAGIAGLIENKKEYAIKYVQRELDARGLSGIDVQVISDKIEAAVHEEINKYKAG